MLRPFGTAYRNQPPGAQHTWTRALRTLNLLFMVEQTSRYEGAGANSPSI